MALRISRVVSVGPTSGLHRLNRLHIAISAPLSQFVDALKPLTCGQLSSHDRITSAKAGDGTCRPPSSELQFELIRVGTASIRASIGKPSFQALRIHRCFKYAGYLRGWPLVLNMRHLHSLSGQRIPFLGLPVSLQLLCLYHPTSTLEYRRSDILPLHHTSPI
jgi:hypothetical protein